MRSQSTTGIYAIIHTASGRVYIGSAVKIESRWDYHRSQLNRRIHPNGYFTAAWHKYGPDAFDFQILETVERARLIEREQYWIDHYRSAERRYGFNIAAKAGSSLGVRQSPATIAKVRAAIIGRKHSAEAKAKMSASKMGNPGRPALGRERRSLTDEQAAAVKTALASGISSPRAAREMGIPEHVTVRIARGEMYLDVCPHLNEAIRLNRPNGKLRGQTARAKLTVSDISVIEQRLSSRETGAAIARDYGVTPNLISQLKQRMRHRLPF